MSRAWNKGGKENAPMYQALEGTAEENLNEMQPTNPNAVT